MTDQPVRPAPSGTAAPPATTGAPAPAPVPAPGPARLPDARPPLTASPASRSHAVSNRVRVWAYRGVAVLLAAALAIGLTLALQSKPVPVELATVERGPLRVTVDEDGRTRVKDRYTVSAPLAGSVGRLWLHAGDSVKRGDVLARILPLATPLLDPRARAEAEARVAAADAARRQAEAGAARAEAAAAYAVREAARERTLFSQGATSRQLLDQAELAERSRAEEATSARFGVRVAQYELEVARAALRRLSTGGAEQLEVRSPVDGVVLRIMQESEGPVPAGGPLLELGDPAALEIVVDVLTSDAVGITPGASVSIERWGGDSALRGHVRTVEPSAFTRLSALGVEEQRVNVLVDLDQPHARWAALGDGFRVEARILVWQADSVLQAPAGAIFRQGQGWAAYRVEEGRARLRPVRIGRQTGARVQILDGLGPGDQVVVYPGDLVTDGREVRAREGT